MHPFGKSTSAAQGATSREGLEPLLHLLVRCAAPQHVDRIVVEALTVVLGGRHGNAELADATALLELWRSVTTQPLNDVDLVPAALPGADDELERRRLKHDLANHLAALTTTREVLELELEREERARYEELELRECRRAGDLLASALAREQTPRLLEGSSIVRTIHDALRSEQAAFDRAGVALECRVEAALANGHYALSETAISRIVRNLLVNAREACERVPQEEPGSPRRRVALEACADHSTRPGLIVTVVDDGPGIDPSIREALFQDGVTTRAGVACEGELARPRGLGLAAVRSLVEGAGGTIRARNLPTGGACFELRLPRA